MPNPVLRVLSHGTGAAILAFGLAGQTPQNPPPKPDPDPQRPTFRTEANFVRVDVYPSRSGTPVTDLERDEFEVFEDGRPQAIETFEYVKVSTAGPHSARSDPDSLEAMRQAAANPRSRIFVIFLDAPHVTSDGARKIGEALIRFIDRSLGPDDLVGVMTPWMSPADVVLARKTEVIASGLREASWARRFTSHEDERESLYKLCYRVLKQELEQGKTVSDLARILAIRRREVMTLEALRDLVVYLRGVREERKAILAITEGWILHRPDHQITRLREECTCPRGMARRDLQDCNGCQPWPPQGPWKERPPGTEPIRIGPGGRLTASTIDTSAGPADLAECTRDRHRLAGIDNEQFARDLASDANRGNATFYAIDPRGLAAFDMPIYRDMDEVGLPQTVTQDRESLSRRHDAMANLAAATDGMALLNSNDLDGGLRRIAGDLSSYYLLGYYSTNAALDGRFRSINVRISRPGVQVRARSGYRAPTEAEVAAARAVAAPPVPEPVSAVSSALARLTRVRPGARFHMHAVPVPGAQSNLVSVVWIAGELPTGIPGWSQGAAVSIEISGTARPSSTEVRLKPGERAFMTAIPLGDGATVIEVRGRLTSAEAGVTPFTESVRLDVSSTAPPQPLLFRRGPTTGNRVQPAADFHFSRSERLRAELPLGSADKPGGGRLLDKTGHALQVPVAIGERTDADTGRRWLTADLMLAPLGSGDYVVEISTIAGGSEQKILTPIRVTR